MTQTPDTRQSETAATAASLAARYSGAAGDGFWREFLTDHRLPDSYRTLAERWYMPLLDRITALRQSTGQTVLLGINGAQGSGKSTLGALLVRALSQLAGMKAVSLSLDDFYLTKAERQHLGSKTHPLLCTRGVPGTHDVSLMSTTLAQLRHHHGEVALPAFDKAIDDRTDPAQWHRVGAPVDVIIWEGWCLGVPPQPDDALQTSVNALEAADDTDGRWRQFVNTALLDYQSVFEQVDLWVMLAAPSFQCVYRWRCEQEEKLKAARGADAPGIMSPDDIARFIQFYQRLTEWGLHALPERVDVLYRLDEDRAISSVSYPKEGSA